MRTVVFWVDDELACILNLKLIIIPLALELLWDLKNTWNFMKALVLFSQLLLNYKVSIWQDEIRVHMYIEIYVLGPTIEKIKTYEISCMWKGTPQKDVIIKSDAPDTLLLEKHADYIASYGSKKDDYVCILLCWKVFIL